MNNEDVMHMRFSLDHLQPSPENRAHYVTEVLSGKLNLFQKEFKAPGFEIGSQPQVINQDYLETD